MEIIYEKIFVPLSILIPRKLKTPLPYNDGFDEHFVTILLPEDLMIFNDQNPIPANALKDDEAVIAYLKLH